MFFRRFLFVYFIEHFYLSSLGELAQSTESTISGHYQSTVKELQLWLPPQHSLPFGCHYNVPVPNSFWMLSPDHSHKSLMMKVYWCKTNFSLYLNEFTHVKFLEVCLAHSKYSINISKYYCYFQNKWILTVFSHNLTNYHHCSLF